jgi:sugar lactone lactonase YvrE
MVAWSQGGEEGIHRLDMLNTGGFDPGRNGRSANPRTGLAGVVMMLLVSLMAGCSPAPSLHGPASASGSPSVTAGGASSPAATTFPGFIDPVGIAFDTGGAAWVADYQEDNLSSFSPAVIAIHGRAHLEPSTIVRSAGGPNELRFDARGTLWVAAWDQGVIRGYGLDALQASSPRPTVTISGPSLNQPTDIAFDHAGTMWVANQATGKIVGFAPDQIRHSGQPKPSVTLRLLGFGADTPEALAFDRRGRLWISSYYDDLVVGLSPSQLSTGVPQPALRLDLPSDSGPIGLTVDAVGRLWVAEASRDRVVAFGVNRLAGRPRPLLTLTGRDLQMPHTVTFDSSGNAWLPCYNGVLARFDASRLHLGTIDGPDLVVS